MTIRMIPVNGLATTAWLGPSVPAGRTYFTAAANGTVDVTCDPIGASDLGSQGLIQIGDGSGPTSTRPSAQNLRPGFLYVDTTLNLIVAWNGSGWVNPITGASS
jgi:hypothetical protein